MAVGCVHEGQCVIKRGQNERRCVWPIPSGSHKVNHQRRDAVYTKNRPPVKHTRGSCRLPNNERRCRLVEGAFCGMRTGATKEKNLEWNLHFYLSDFRVMPVVQAEFLLDNKYELDENKNVNYPTDWNLYMTSRCHDYLRYIIQTTPEYEITEVVILATAWAYLTRCNTELSGTAHKECAQCGSPHKLHKYQKTVTYQQAVQHLISNCLKSIDW